MHDWPIRFTDLPVFLDKSQLFTWCQGTYGEIYNFRPEAWNEILDNEAVSEEEAPEFVVDEEDEEEWVSTLQLNTA